MTLLLLRTEISRRGVPSPGGEKHHTPHTTHQQHWKGHRNVFTLRLVHRAQRGKAASPRSQSNLAPDQPWINGRDTVSYSSVFFPAQPNREQLDS